jgi:hypothetical protein
MFTPSQRSETKNTTIMKTINAKNYLIELAKEIIVKNEIQDSILIQRELTNHIEKLENKQDFTDINLDAVQYLAKQGLSK